jgi:hypothetical protein
MSPTFSTNRGSVESLKVSLRCGANEKAFQMRCTVEMDTPDLLAIERVLQCVASAGIVSSVFVTTKAMNRVDAWRMIQRRAAEIGTRARIGCHTFRATGITAYLEAGGTLENAQAMAAHDLFRNGRPKPPNASCAGRGLWSDKSSNRKFL